MATYTNNYNLTMPEAEDFFKIQDFNENFEAIDTLMAENDSAVQEVNEKLGTPNDGETVFSLLKSGGSFFKSIQHITLVEATEHIQGETIPIAPVDPAKCIVILERLADTSTVSASKVSYELSQDNIKVTRTYPLKTIFGFWIIECN